MKIDFIPVREIMRMGGPWEGKLRIGDTNIDGDFLDQNNICVNDKCYFVKVFKPISPEKISSKYLFAIFAINSEGKRYLSRQLFNYLYIESMQDEDIIIYESFNSADESKKLIIRFNNENFVELT